MSNTLDHLGQKIVIGCGVVSRPEHNFIPFNFFAIKKHDKEYAYRLIFCGPKEGEPYPLECTSMFAPEKEIA
jgi:hypothetical protein